jgi:hypothetical protein
VAEGAPPRVHTSNSMAKSTPARPPARDISVAEVALGIEPSLQAGDVAVLRLQSGDARLDELGDVDGVGGRPVIVDALPGSRAHPPAHGRLARQSHRWLRLPHR